MTIYEHLDARRRDIDEKVARNGLTSGLVVQKREVLKALEHLSIEDGSKEYVPEVKKPVNDGTLEIGGRYRRYPKNEHN